MMHECRIAEKLAALRTAKGVTQEDVAKSLSVSNKTVSKWEKGASAPDLSMLIGLAKYYGVSTDALLGLAEEREMTAGEVLRRKFERLDRREAVMRAYEIVRAIMPAMYDRISVYDDDVNDDIDVFPAEIPHFYRSEIALHEFYDFIACSENVNIAVMMLRNKANFSWLKDPEKQKEMVRFFKFLSCEDTLSVLYFIHTTACFESFTAEYISRNTGIKEERVSEILDEFCAVGNCRRNMAYLTEGETKIYECFGDGIILSALTLAYEKMCGRESYTYHFNGRSKMIGGK